MAHSPTATSSVRHGVLLAGGAARRMGVDKRVLTLGGRSLQARGLDLLRSLFPWVALSVGPDVAHLDLGDAQGVTILPDAHRGPSPLAGIVTALERFQAPVFVCAVDIAFPDPHVARTLLAQCSEASACVPEDPGGLEPLFAVYRPDCLNVMRSLLDQGKFRVVTAFEHLDVRKVRFEEATPFLNVNQPQDFAQAQQVARARGARPPQPALVAIVGKSDSGKTTQVERLLPHLKRLGLTLATVKHDAHDFEIDHPGKDSYRHGAAGADAYVVASPARLAYVGRLSEEMPLTAIVRRFFHGVDLVVVEGYKRTAPHRIEIFRQAAGHTEPLCAPGESLALVTDTELPHPARFGLDDAQGLAAFISLRLDSLRRY